MSIAKRLGLGSSKGDSTDNEIVEEMEEVINEFQQGQFQKTKVKSLQELIERVTEIKKR